MKETCSFPTEASEEFLDSFCVRVLFDPTSFTEVYLGNSRAEALSRVLERCFRLNARLPDGVESDAVGSPLYFFAELDGVLVSDGKCIRFVTADKERVSSSTVVPVLLGDKGDAIMGAGRVRRLR